MWIGSDRLGGRKSQKGNFEFTLHNEVMIGHVHVLSSGAVSSQVKCPVYIVHGTNDEVISYSHAEDLVRNCQEGIAYPPYLVENGGHNNLEAAHGCAWLRMAVLELPAV